MFAPGLIGKTFNNTLGDCGLENELSKIVFGWQQLLFAF